MNKAIVRKRILYTILFIIIICWTLIQIYPILMMFVNSIKTESELAIEPWGLPKTFSFKNWIDVWTGRRTGSDMALGKFFINSLIVSMGSILLILIVAVNAGYAFAFFKFKGKKISYSLQIAMIAVPTQALIIPIFHMMSVLDLTNNYIGLIGVYTAFMLPFTIIIMTANFREIPFELIEVARLDGCSEFRIIWTIIIPVAKGIILSLAILSLIGIWNELLYAFLLMNRYDTKTLTVGILSLKGQYVIKWTGLFAGLSISSLPIIILYIIFQKQISKSMTLGALK